MSLSCKKRRMIEMERMTKGAWNYLSNFNAKVFVSGEYVTIEIGFTNDEVAKSAMKSAFEPDYTEKE
jgi:hypothetical protein